MRGMTPMWSVWCRAEIDDRTVALHAKIADAAYFRAEKRGFEAGHELDDWLAAESEIAYDTRP
jgi:hypothetical protein